MGRCKLSGSRPLHMRTVSVTSVSFGEVTEWSNLVAMRPVLVFCLVAGIGKGAIAAGILTSVGFLRKTRC